MADVVLKNCPFCGGSPRQMRADISDMTVDYPMRFIGCAVCLAQGPIGKDDKEAEDKWNARSV